MLPTELEDPFMKQETIREGNQSNLCPNPRIVYRNIWILPSQSRAQTPRTLAPFALYCIANRTLGNIPSQTHSVSLQCVLEETRQEDQ